MRCPKCHYITFDSGERCRNCGYEFALAPDPAEPELSLRGDEPIGPYADLSLRVPGDAADPDLPLFGTPALLRPRGGDESPLITPSASPRPPLAVRRTTPDSSRLRHRAVRRRPPEEPTLEFRSRESDAGADPGPPGHGPAGTDGPGTDLRQGAGGQEPGPCAAPPARRLFAAFVDTVLLGAIDLAVLYFTLRLCGLSSAEVHILPVIPLASFLLLLNGGYVVSLTAAGGQTLGKMLAGLQVVTGAGDRIGLGPAVSRAGGYVVSALPAGLGFLPAFFGTDRRALHDRIADTKVVTVQN